MARRSSLPRLRSPDELGITPPLSIMHTTLSVNPVGLGLVIIYCTVSIVSSKRLARRTQRPFADCLQAVWSSRWFACFVVFLIAAGIALQLLIRRQWVEDRQQQRERRSISRSP